MRQPSAGPIVLFSDVEVAVRDSLKQWLPFYLGEIDAQLGLERGTTGQPRFYDIASEDSRRWLEATPPSLLVVCPGTVGQPERHGKQAAYGAWWQVNVAVTAGGATEDGTRQIAGRLAGAIEYVVAQQSDMGGLAEDARWMGTRTDVVARDRSMLAVEVEAHVFVPQIVSTRGPLLPVVAPGGSGAAAPLPEITGSQITTNP